MSVKVSVQIIMKIVMIMMLIFYLPQYTLQSAKVYKANANVQSEKPVVAASVPVSGKRVHIYNTHQSEEYNGFNVKEGARYLKDCLSEMGYYCDVEENDFENYKSIHQIAYNKSYTVSKMYLQQAVANNGSYDLIIDFHRDSIDRQYSTVSANNKSYAKIMFVVGKSSGKFESVNSLCETLSAKANEYVEGITRGIMVKSSHYNQGDYDHTILIEFGGQSNTKEEVQNTIEIMALVIRDYLQ